jgi:hypothetical protein
MKPIFVYVEWSESNLFNEKSIYTFQEFETLCLCELKTKQTGGYTKTKIEVLFSNGLSYGCRLDICQDTPNFYQHAKAVIETYESRIKDYNNDNKFIIEQTRACYGLLKAVDWN